MFALVSGLPAAGSRRLPLHHDDREYGVAQFDRWIEHDNRALNLGPVLEIDTTNPVDIPAIAAWLRMR